MFSANPRRFAPTIWRRICYALLKLVVGFCAYLIARWSGASDRLAISLVFILYVLIGLFRYAVRAWQEDIVPHLSEADEEVSREKPQ